MGTGAGGTEPGGSGEVPVVITSRRRDGERPEPGENVDRAGIDEDARHNLEVELREAVRGEVRFDAGTRAAYATDSSNYRQVPLGVIFPVDHEDVAMALRVCRAHDAPVLGRGAGTSLAGQACNVAVVFDFTRHMNRIIGMDPVTRTVRVQPGVVLDDLQAAVLKVAPLAFGPDPATHAWCSVGGMIGNNSCGTHALSTGKTVDNVDSLRVLTYEGQEFEVKAGSIIQAPGDEDGASAEQITSQLRSLALKYGALVRTRFPDIPRRVSGYNLDQLLPENGFHVARSLVGTESTCVIVTEATLRLSERPEFRTLLVLGYGDIYLAADATPSLLKLASDLGAEYGMKHALIGLEGFDRTLIGQMYRASLNIDSIAMLPRGNGWLLAEIGGHSSNVVDEISRSFVDALPADVLCRRFDDPSDQAMIWRVRESALGATARPQGESPNQEGWEDAAVPPERLGGYLRAITELWKEYDYSGAWYGHFGQGCVHTRNNFDLASQVGLAKYRSYLERAADICIGFGGSLSGEHGDGQGRGELLTRMFGEELVNGFAEFKSIWDPLGRMNPGKVVDPFPLDTNLRHGPKYRRTKLGNLYYKFLDDEGSLQNALDRCVGVGRCRRTDIDVMCPSYRVTLDERHSTRGRARLFGEMLQGEVLTEQWQSEEVREALDLCLGCKGCATDCPTHVDMATYKSEFFAHYYEGRRRPLNDYVLARLPHLVRSAARSPRFANAMMGDHPLGRLARRSIGITTSRPAPQLARKSFRRSSVAKELSASVERQPTVIVFPDTFSNSFRPELLRDTIRALERAGERVAVPQTWACCGRTLYDSGRLEEARSTLVKLLDVLEPFVRIGLQVVVAEPSCLASFRDELPNLLPDDPRSASLAGAARSLSEHLLTIEGLSERVVESSSVERILVHPHCHGRSIGTSLADKRLLERLGCDVEILDAGCCGLAGAFGFQEEHAEVSRKVAEDWWLPRLSAKAASADLVILDGFSCALQYEHLSPTSSTRVASLAALVSSRLKIQP
jgi:FAD/FMN-containing dehydrogenase/Fe-S oxidoreductase